MRKRLWGTSQVRAAMVFISGIFVGMYMSDYVAAVFQAISFGVQSTPGT